MEKDSREFMLAVLSAVGSEHTRDLWWRVDGKYAPITFFINCNDVFAWASSDCERVTPENIEVLKQSYKDSEDQGGVLFVARVRKLRPQGAFYTYIDEAEWPLFHAAGPEREVGIGNPYAPGEYKTGA